MANDRKPAPSSQPETARRARKPRERIGDLLIRHGKLNRDQLDHALKIQSNMGGMLGDILVELGLISENDLAKALAEIIGLERLDLSRPGVIDPKAAQVIPEALAQRHMLIGARFQPADPESTAPDRIVIAMADPSDFMALDSIRTTTNLEPQPAVATRSQISNALRTAYLEVPQALDQTVGELKGFRIENPRTAQPTTDSGRVRMQPRTTRTIRPGGQQPNSETARVRSEAELDTAVRFVNSLLFEASNRKARDIHIEPQESQLRCRMRVDGELRTFPPPPKHLQPAIISRIKALSGLDVAEQRVPQEGRLDIHFQGRGINARVSTMPTVFGEKVVLRLFDQAVIGQGLHDLGFSAELRDDLRRIIGRQGLFVACGPSGCGKSTTLYGLLRELNRPGSNLVTLEDPVEYRIEGVNQTEIRPSSGLTFASGLRMLLNQDPDVVMVGEIRDLETLDAAARGAISGRLVLGAMYADNAVGGVSRMIDMGLDPYLIASTLNATMSQRLLRRVCPSCVVIEPVVPGGDEAVRRRLGRNVDFAVAHAVGCEKCEQTGYAGRAVLAEIFEPDSDIRDLIRRGAGEDVLREAAIGKGMNDLSHNAWLTLKAGLTTVEEVVSLR